VLVAEDGRSSREVGDGRKECERAGSCGVRAREVQLGLFEGKGVQRCLIDLLSRESKDELGGLG